VRNNKTQTLQLHLFVVRCRCRRWSCWCGGCWAWRVTWTTAARPPSASSTPSSCTRGTSWRRDLSSMHARYCLIWHWYTHNISLWCLNEVVADDHYNTIICYCFLNYSWVWVVFENLPYACLKQNITIKSWLSFISDVQWIKMFVKVK